MRKEVVFAVLAGGALGLIIAFGVWRANIALSPKEKGAKTEASPTPKPEFAITIAKPSANDVITQATTVITGITKPFAYLALSAEAEDYVIQADAKGSFEIEVDLIGEVNQIVIYAFDEKGNEVNTNLLLVYSSEFQKYITNRETQEEQGAATDSVREKVRQKVSEALNSPKAVLGTVTDISEKTLQIKTTDGAIEQLAVAGDTSVVKVGKTAKEVKLADIAIGDFIVSMGYTSSASGGKNGNGVLDTKRILISSPLAEVTRKAVFVKVFKNNKKDLLTQFLKGEEDQTIVPEKNVSVMAVAEGKAAKIKFADLLPDSTLIALGTASSQKFSARTIFVVKKP